MSIWALHHVTKRFRNRSAWSGEASVLAVNDVSLSVDEGEHVGIIGASGSGKTTLARLGLGLVEPTHGEVRLFDENAAGWSSSRWRKERVRAQLLFQDPAAMLNPQIPVGLLLEESAALHRPEMDPVTEAHRVLEDVGLPDKYSSLPGELSGGERRRAGIARLLLTRPRLVVTDELTTGLDAALKADLVELLFRCLGPACAVVFISHDLPLVLWCCSRVVVMYKGEAVDRFDVADALAPDRHPHTRSLMAAAGLVTP